MDDNLLFYPAAAVYYAACLGWVALAAAGCAMWLFTKPKRLRTAAFLWILAGLWVTGLVLIDREARRGSQRLEDDFAAVSPGMDWSDVQRVIGLPTAVKRAEHVPMLWGLPHRQPWFETHDQLIFEADQRWGWSYPLPHWPYWHVQPFLDCPWLSGWFAERFTLKYLRHVQQEADRRPPVLLLISIDDAGKVVAKHRWPPGAPEVSPASPTAISELVPGVVPAAGGR